MHRLLFLLTVVIILVSGCGTGSGQVKLVESVDQIKGMENYNPKGTLPEAFSKDVLYEVSKLSWEGEKGEAEVIVTVPNLKQIILDSINTAINEVGTDDYDALLNRTRDIIVSTLDSNGYPILESIIVMEAEKRKSGYVLISNDEFATTVKGNLEDIFVDVIKETFTNDK